MATAALHTARAGALARRRDEEEEPAEPVTIGDPQSGSQTSVASTTQVVTLPAHGDTDTLMAVLARNVVSGAPFTASDSVSLVEQIQVGSRRLTVVSFTAPTALGQLTLTGASGVWSWAVFNVADAVFGATAPGASGNSTTAALEFPTIAAQTGTGNERVLAAAATNSTAAWSGFSGTGRVELSGPPGLFVGSAPLSDGATSASFDPISRGSDGVNRLESSLLLVLRP